jgi:ATP-dependent 26S proteasome regulatory subunit
VTKSQQTAADLVAALRARNPLIWIRTAEELRVEKYIFEAAAAAGYVPYTWDVAQGVTDIAGKLVPGIVDGSDPGDTLKAIRDYAKRPAAGRKVWILRDLAPWLAGPIGIATVRQLRNLTRLLPGTPREVAQAIVVLTPSADVPIELSSVATVIDWPLPDRDEIGGILDATLASLPEDVQLNAVPNGARSTAVDAAVGLTADRIQTCFAESLVKLRRIDPVLVTREKRRVLAEEKVLEWIDPPAGGLDVIGGLDALKTRLTARSAAYSTAARNYGLPAPRGALFVGVPGCGKSLMGKAVAAAWRVPLLRLDLNALRSKYVGESEANLRRAFRVIEAVGRAVIWIDEIEKALAGATQGAADGGIASDALGAVLSWMQERQGEAFIIATSNDIEGLPPELLRKGRFDEIWFVDTPTKRERIAVLEATLRTYNRDRTGLDLDRIASVTEGFTGAELSALVPDGMFTAFADGARPLSTADLLAAVATVTPLVKTAEKKIRTLREWAQGRARPATSDTDIDQAQASAPPRLRALDL